MTNIRDFKKITTEEICLNLLYGGEAQYDNFKTDKNDGLVFFDRKNTYDRAKVIKTLKGCGEGNVYEVNFTCRICDDSPLDKATLLVGFMGVDDTKCECPHTFLITKEKKDFSFTYTVKNADKNLISFEQAEDDVSVLSAFAIEEIKTSLLSGKEDSSNDGNPIIKFDREGKTVIHLIGDSIVCNYDENEKRRGWGMFIGEYFDSEKIKVNNMAKGGYSTKTFLKCLSGLIRWNCVYDNMEKGDYLFVSLGINDSAKNMWKSVDIKDYKKYLKTMADKAKEKGVSVIFVTPTITLEDNKLNNMRRDRAEKMIEAANESGAYLLDLNKLMFSEAEKKISEMGFGSFWQKYFGALENDGANDITHQCEEGSRWVLSLIMKLLSKTDCPLNNYRKSEK